ncbi:GNAT family N-acetyltransferase [Aquimarina intermedia]|uniref:N-acetylglutamate synthase-like GNAT family acetyltransferase n=1 Tax=Aquimarina intermedia TaxID=350814 RepID=A0A5S5CCY1_9FLAO|nr:GNAT family N-acetyltransferase [Aquimarina intermedia]TYP77009.1 N-acetylglutamate synthase-like GNAT family acetyltransferase [Aquimarina intermedia]
MIAKATLSDVEQIFQLTQACAKALIANGIYQWNEHYPTRKRFELDIERDEMYTFKNDGVLMGIIVLTPVMDEEYKPIDWLTENNSNLYIHRLAVHPDYWGNGIAKQLMEFGEAYAREQNYQSVRLDTFSQNTRNQSFYKKRGYQQVGEIFFPNQSEFPFYCFELVW